jgi:hypothetical protein
MNDCAEPNILDTVVTGDESWIFAYNPETKRQSMQWKTKNSPYPTKACMPKSKMKTMLIVFFYSKEVLLQEYIPPDQTVNQHYYITILECL